VTQYAQDPSAHRREMMALGRRGVADLPPMAQLAVADAYLRSNRLRSATRLFDSLLLQDPGEPWTGLAALGRGWVAARRGRMEEARGYFASAAELPGSSGLMGDFMVGMIDAGDGLGSEALDRFARIEESSEASRDLRLAAVMGEGYARFWMGDDAGARAAFARAAASAPEHGIAEDARFGEALARWREGDVAGAEERLASLAGSPAQSSKREGTIGLATLDPRAILRAGAQRYRRLPLGMPVDRLLAMLDGEAGAMARVALRRLRRGEGPPPPITPARDGYRMGRAGAASSPDASGLEPASSEGRPTAHEAVGGRTRAPVVVVVVGMMLALVLFWRGGALRMRSIQR
jgi:tetratricopeptide (TPR) repeat protein